MANFPVIDTTVVLERVGHSKNTSEKPWVKRPTGLWPRGVQP
jgi:hypothetical protein